MLPDHLRVMEGGVIECPSEYERAQESARTLLIERLGRTEGARRHIVAIPWAVLDAEEIPDPQWLVEGMLEERSVVGIFGQPKSAKSWAGLDMILSLATGTSAFGGGEQYRVARAVKVVAYLAEEAKVHVRRRLRALSNGKSLTENERAARSNNLSIIERQALDICDDAQLVDLLACLLLEKPTAVMLDPLVDIASIDNENDNSEMAKVMERLRVIRDVIGCAVIFVHHAGHGGKGGGGRRSAMMSRGASSVPGKADGGINISADDDASNKTTKVGDVSVFTRNGQTSDGFRLTLNIVDDLEKRATSAAWMTEPLDKSSTPKGKGGTFAEKKVLEALTTVPTGVGRIASKAGCSDKTARAHLLRLAEQGKAQHHDRFGWSLPSASTQTSLTD